ncbi:sialate O-acetylesterase [Dyadobacter psychrotolerans]|uniref:Sialate O-acetylesterase n=1 Tax=Dyadobacter psychrotolerans TaxID=2541721 RepID=A0A4R5DR10_9BACT|nr:sialate O-acetylesterase [Dyadobacter psychrotolerans]TDE14714.1 sialate O-acetylesterase [Dyadobacter psychrotolerans]
MGILRIVNKGVKITTRFILLVVLSAGVSMAQNAPEKMDLYLLIGQSNMAGRGKLSETTQQTNENIWVINGKNEWVMAKDPLHYDKPAAVGVGPGLSFAKAISEYHPEKKIGLIPCAVGGSGIDDWVTGKKHDQTGIFSYDSMLARVKEAQKHGKIKGIIWHQGESDSSPEKSAVYEQKLTAFFKLLRKQTGTKKTPLILGTLGDFYVAKRPDASKVNQIMHDYASKHKHAYVVSSSGLTDLGDGTHFNTQSAQELGKRYGEMFLKVSGK